MTWWASSNLMVPALSRARGSRLSERSGDPLQEKRTVQAQVFSRKGRKQILRSSLHSWRLECGSCLGIFQAVGERANASIFSFGEKPVWIVCDRVGNRSTTYSLSGFPPRN